MAMNDDSFSSPSLREWFDALPNNDYWGNCRARAQESIAKDRAAHDAQRT
ncbi:hypothetical protein [Brevibacterium sp. SMBL_HHYL_HB1]|nr:hypothetical protein [Brevibacterium sp. SMBL_HHYL_HB1]QUL78026.1 hypothetical protein IG171_11085 [Brevibacterium sp. SMBL_HHYL_HB1]